MFQKCERSWTTKKDGSTGVSIDDFQTLNNGWNVWFESIGGVFLKKSKEELSEYR
jgi:hypothetical protein